MVRIAILEDRLSYARDLAALIEMEVAGARVSTFSNVDAALDAASGVEEWDVWVVDLMMPTGSTFSAEDAENGLATGTRFIEQLIKSNRMPKRKIVVITSRNTDKDNFEKKSPMIVECQKADFTQVDIAKEVRKAIRG